MTRASWWNVVFGLAGLVALALAYLLWVATPDFPIVPFLGGALGGAFIGASLTGLVLTRGAAERKPIPSHAAGIAEIDRQLLGIRQAISGTEAAIGVAEADVLDAHSPQWRMQSQGTYKQGVAQLEHFREQERAAVAERAKVAAMTDRQWRAYVRKSRR
ncbi:hypothetical protein [Leifsonia sp. RAF41]|uniref:hypothetical protein n=1 Tax=Leifsonia sp. RAF41 TaxID=3233056 RepID=UPI003F9D3184